MENNLTMTFDTDMNRIAILTAILDHAGGANPILKLIHNSSKLPSEPLISYSTVKNLHTQYSLFIDSLYDKSIYISKKLFLRDTKQHLHFRLATQEIQNEVRTCFIKQQNAGSFETKIDSKKIKRVTSDNLDDLASMTGLQIKNLIKEGLDHIDELGIVTGGAGLWSRGGGSVKALVPYNISKLLGNNFKELSNAGQIVSAKSSKEILQISKIDITGLYPQIIEEMAIVLKENAIICINKYQDKIIYHLSAINSLDLKFANIATTYFKSGKYITFDIWTSEHTHKKISAYVLWLKKNISRKIFHPDRKVNEAIRLSMIKYFQKSDELDETHLFGFQEGLHAVNTKTGLYNNTSAIIGKGAGAIIEYLEKSGRMDLLRSRGKKTLVFENIEVVSDYAPLFASHRNANLPVSVVLVPQKEGYVGGSPFLIQKDNGEWNMELIEQSVLNDELKSGNQYFNTNTIFFSTEVKAPKTLTFEMKEQNRIARVKQNMGDVTFENSTHGIGGRLGHDQKMVEYENFKSYDEYGANGEFYIQTFQKCWSEIFS